MPQPSEHTTEQLIFLLRECRFALESVLAAHPGLARAEHGSTTLGNLCAELSPFRSTYALMGRSYRVRATFPDSDSGTELANAYMQANPSASVLAVAGGRIILADKDDPGVPVRVADL